jgi:hypothetical protein
MSILYTRARLQEGKMIGLRNLKNYRSLVYGSTRYCLKGYSTILYRRLDSAVTWPKMANNISVVQRKLHYACK